MNKEIADWIAYLTRPRSILVVDVDPTVRLMFKCASDHFALTAHFAHTIEEAKEALSTHPYDFLFVDIRAALGRIALKLVSSEYPSVQCVALSDSAEVQVTLSLGAPLILVHTPPRLTSAYIGELFKLMCFQPGSRLELPG